jgi:hypothetical protein
MEDDENIWKFSETGPASFASYLSWTETFRELPANILKFSGHAPHRPRPTG